MVWDEARKQENTRVGRLDHGDSVVPGSDIVPISVLRRMRRGGGVSGLWSCFEKTGKEMCIGDLAG